MNRKYLVCLFGFLFNVLGCNSNSSFNNIDSYLSDRFENAISASKMIDEYGYANAEIKELFVGKLIDEVINTKSVKKEYEILVGRNSFNICEYWVKSEILKITIKGKLYKQPFEIGIDKNIKSIEFGGFDGAKKVKEPIAIWSKRKDINDIITHINKYSYINYRSVGYRKFDKNMEYMSSDGYITTNLAPTHYLQIDVDGFDELDGYYLIHKDGWIGWWGRWDQKNHYPIFICENLLKILSKISIKIS